LLSTVFLDAEKPADAQFYPHWNPLPRQILQLPPVAAVYAPRFLPAHWTTTRLARRSQHHNEPTVALDRQLIQYHFTGIRHQCSLFHRLLPETARACHSSTAIPPSEKVANVIHVPPDPNFPRPGSMSPK
jgi:hypothetical protein